MTTVVAIAHHGHVYFGADTAFTTDCQMTDPEGKLMTLPGLIALGTANDKRAATVLRYAFTPPPFPAEMSRPTCASRSLKPFVPCWRGTFTSA